MLNSKSVTVVVTRAFVKVTGIYFLQKMWEQIQHWSGIVWSSVSCAWQNVYL